MEEERGSYIEEDRQTDRQTGKREEINGRSSEVEEEEEDEGVPSQWTKGTKERHGLRERERERQMNKWNEGRTRQGQCTCTLATLQKVVLSTLGRQLMNLRK
jgi:hypothetical protein